MARVQIELPKHFIFQAEIPVRITDINYGNHLGNDALLTILHEARMQFLQQLGFSEKDISGAGIIMADVSIQYKAEAFYGDTLTIKIAVSEITRVTFDIIYKITSKQKVIAIAKTGMVCYDYNQKKIVAVPEAFIEKTSIHF